MDTSTDESARDPLITFADVALGYGGRPLMDPVSLTVHPGEFWGIVGPNGAGKSTLLKTMVGLVPPVAGSRTLTPPDLHFGYVPQRHSLSADFPLSTFDVALMGRYDHRTPGRRLTRQDRDQVHAALARVDMERFAHTRFAALSGGQQQRALIARALVSEPDVLLLDEPTEGVDLPGETEILRFLGRLHAAHGTTVLMVVHHMEQVASVVDHICLINRHTNLFRLGRTEDLLGEEGLTEVYGRPVEITRCHDRIHIHVRDGDGDGRTSGP